jgi:hypothetical protein
MPHALDLIACFCRARKLLHCGLLQRDNKLLASAVRETPTLILLQTNATQLYVDPKATILVGLSVTQPERTLWEEKWAQRTQVERQSAEEETSALRRSEGQQAGGGSGNGGRQCSERVTPQHQQQPCSQQQSVLGPTSPAAQQQQPQQQLDDRRQQLPPPVPPVQPQQQQQPAGAGADMRVQLPDAVQPAAGGGAAASQPLPPAGANAAAPNVQVGPGSSAAWRTERQAACVQCSIC